jgi:hypothetical protein
MRTIDRNGVHLRHGKVFTKAFVYMQMRGEEERRDEKPARLKSIVAWEGGRSEGAHHAVGRVDDVQETVFVLVLLIDLRKEGARLGQRVAIHEEEDGLVGPEVDVLPDFRNELRHGDVARGQEPAKGRGALESRRRNIPYGKERRRLRTSSWRCRE